MSQRAVLLVNLGSPDSTSVPDVTRYLREFLGDERVIDRPPQPFRSLLVKGIIIPARVKKSAHAYEQIWTEAGSPLIVTSKSVQAKLAAALGDTAKVYLAMRYGNPSIPSVIAEMLRDGVTEILLFPQYPHYAMSSYETVVVRVMEEVARQAPGVKVTTVQPFYADADYIAALHAVAAPFLSQPHDLVLFSYHGIPVRHLRKADSSCAHCQKVADCCNTPSPAHATCYKAQCLATTRAFAAKAGLASDRHFVSFQSRLVGEPWLSPYTDETLGSLPAKGVKRVIMLCPAFMTDCLETLEEIQQEGRDTFIEAGGESFQQIPCLNDHPAAIEFLANRVRSWLS